MKGFQLAAACAFFVATNAIPMTVRGQTAVRGPDAKGTWTQMAPMITPRSEVSLAEVGGKIYVVGGGINGTAVPHNEEYDIATNKWRVRYPMPRGLDHMGVAVVNGKIITVGGFVGAGVHRDGQPLVFEYDPATDAWRALAPMKAGRGSVGVAALNGKVYAIGGRTPAGDTVATNEVYDPANNTWTALAPLPKARDHMAVVAAEGKIHAIGGRFMSSADRTDLHDIYDPATNTWTSGPPLPTARSGLAYAYYKGMAIVLGGEFPQEKRTFVENEGFDVKANTWRILAPMPQGRHAAGATSDGKNLYVGGGSFLPGGAGGGPIGELMVFNLP
jgi:N-acetylneuraminic acid mutarotase